MYGNACYYGYVPLSSSFGLCPILVDWCGPKRASNCIKSCTFFCKKLVNLGKFFAFTNFVWFSKTLFYFSTINGFLSYFLPKNEKWILCLSSWYQLQGEVFNFFNILKQKKWDFFPEICLLINEWAWNFFSFGFMDEPMLLSIIGGPPFGIWVFKACIELSWSARIGRSAWEFFYPGLSVTRLSLQWTKPVTPRCCQRLLVGKAEFSCWIGYWMFWKAFDLLWSFWLCFWQHLDIPVGPFGYGWLRDGLVMAQRLWNCSSCGEKEQHTSSELHLKNAKFFEKNKFFFFSIKIFLEEH